ncbi:hypothetical protein GCK72_021246 [Caenorhabditis remanei]|uniref:F-box domain-containing protein n=1 Tax=Caenorhabditis remanei TaxID=31234 RepID=A0A6A5GJK5_CAERE|nr:hypothetical protein GCK72_021246 [Caenorhabditis remanei]KAF1754682.1 hypothetical protein GCK72_021246 [Caenorhabditis remanei]
MTTPFPLLCLPRLALIPVFQHMELMEVIAFSFLSKRTHYLSKYLRKKTSFRYIDLGIENNGVCMWIALTNVSHLALYFYTDDSTMIKVMFPYKKIQWNNIGLSTEQWVERVLDVTKCPSLRKLKLDAVPKFDVFSVFDVIPEVTELEICPNFCNALAKRALQVLSPVTSSINMHKAPFSNQEEFQSFWMSNVDCLSIYNDNLSRFQFNISYLLISNAVKLELREVSLKLKDLNRFFSYWLNKTSNHRLEHLSVKSLTRFNEDILLKGLNATRFTENRTREFFSTKTFNQLRHFTGGSDVRRKDGKLAAITFGDTFWRTNINFDVWS